MKINHYTLVDLGNIEQLTSIGTILLYAVFTVGF